MILILLSFQSCYKLEYFSIERSRNFDSYLEVNTKIKPLRFFISSGYSVDLYNKQIFGNLHSFSFGGGYYRDGRFLIGVIPFFDFPIGGSDTFRYFSVNKISPGIKLNLGMGYNSFLGGEFSYEKRDLKIDDIKSSISIEKRDSLGFGLSFLYRGFIYNNELNNVFSLLPYLSLLKNKMEYTLGIEFRITPPGRDISDVDRTGLNTGERGFPLFKFFLSARYRSRKVSKSDKFSLSVGLYDPSGNPVKGILSIEGIGSYNISEGKNRVNLKEGKYNLNFYSKGYMSVDTTIYLVQNTEINIFFKKCIKGTIVYICLRDKKDNRPVMGNVVVINGLNLSIKADSTGMCIAHLKPGSYILKAMGEDYISKNYYLEVKQEKKINLTIYLEKVK